MEKAETKGEFDYYTIDWKLNEEAFSTALRSGDGETVCYYNQCGTAGEIVEFYNFVIVPGFSTPDWAKGAVMYQIYTDRFYNGDPSNDVETNEYYYIGGYSSRVKDWGEISGDYGRAGILRRRLRGVMEKLDYLQGPGC